MITVGIDIGSVAAKAVVLNTATRAVLSHAMQPTGWNHKQAIADVLAAALNAAQVSANDVYASALTGYGRVALKDTMQTVSEISCHAKGAHFFFPEANGVVDIGGQDSKAITFNSSGLVVDFIMNDKCAAGTGRFVSMVATLLETDLNTFASLSHSGQPLLINSMCAVFAESEVVGLLAKGHNPADIAAGIATSIATRTASLATRLGLANKACVFSGGLAQNQAVAAKLGDALGTVLLIPPHPQFVGAVGAALLAKQAT